MLSPCWPHDFDRSCERRGHSTCPRPSRRPQPAELCQLSCASLGYSSAPAEPGHRAGQAADPQGCSCPGALPSPGGQHGWAVSAGLGAACGHGMWAFLAQLLVALALLAFFLVSCQNVMHIVRGSVSFLLKHAHHELDKELGESQGLADDEEVPSAWVVRRRVLVKVTGRELRAAAEGRGGGERRRGRAGWEAVGCASAVPFCPQRGSPGPPETPWCPSCHCRGTKCCICLESR